MAKNFRSRFGMRSVMLSRALFERNAQVLLLEHAVEFLADRGRHFLGDQVEAGGQAVSGPQRPGDQLQGVGQLLGELLQAGVGGEAAARSAAARPAASRQRQHDRRDASRRPAGPTCPPRPVTPRNDEELRRRQRRVGLLEQQAAGCRTAPELVRDEPWPVVERLRQHAAP